MWQKKSTFLKCDILDTSQEIHIKSKRGSEMIAVPCTYTADLRHLRLYCDTERESLDEKIYVHRDLL